MHKCFIFMGVVLNIWKRGVINQSKNHLQYWRPPNSFLLFNKGIIESTRSLCVLNISDIFPILYINLMNFVVAGSYCAMTVAKHESNMNCVNIFHCLQVCNRNAVLVFALYLCHGIKETNAYLDMCKKK